jgi:chromosome partitioning protein
MITISIAIQKGGSGKTTTAVNLAAAFKRAGKRVLVIDADPQSNLTNALGIVDEPEPNIYHLLRGVGNGTEVDVGAAIVTTASGLDVLPASLELAAAEMELVSVYGREHLLAHIVGLLRGSYDLVLIDCPPSIGILTVNALVASDWVLMPLQAEFLPMKGLRSFLRSMNVIKQRLNRRLDLLGIVLSRYDDRRLMNRDIRQQLESEFEGKLFETKIRSNIAVAKAQENGLDIFSFDDKTNGAKDYAALAAEVLLRISNND